MRKLLPLLSVLLAIPSIKAAHGQRPATLTSVQDVVALSNAEAGHGIPVKLEGTVTYVQPQDASLFVQTDALGVYVNFSKDIGLLPGDRVEITGETEASFRPEINAREVRFLAHGSLPAPRAAKFEDLIEAKLDSVYVTVEGHVLSAAMDGERPVPGLRIEVRVPQGLIGGVIAGPGQLRPEDLLGADVRLTGVAGGAFDSKMQMAGAWLDIGSPAGVSIERAASEDPWAQRAVPMDQVVYAFRSTNDSKRVRIEGTLTYFEPGLTAVIEDNGHSMLVGTVTTTPLHAGMEVEATGFPEVTDETVWLNHGEVRQTADTGHVQPQSIGWEAASQGKFAYNLVSMEGQIVAEVHDSRVDLFIIQADGHLYSATLRHSSSDAALDAVTGEEPTVGARVRVTGVCFMDSGNHWRDRLWFDVRMRSLRDITVLEAPPWWTVKRLSNLITVMSALILAAVIWAGLLDRRLRQKSAILARQNQEDAMRERRLARQEQERSHILELVSSSAPLQEVLREIQAMVSARLYGASCWFELHAAEPDGIRIEKPDDDGIAYQELFSRDGNSLGFLLATPLLNARATAEVATAMKAGARLAELAIETRRLYSDLRHRSEYDLLTEIPNRFSMEKRLDQLMQAAIRCEAVFGVIYVDLDRFKQVNDRFGHRIGDLYLQEVTRRMKDQLRGGDVLARIGGDEFIALVPILRSRRDAEEIVERLERCFDEPFDLDGMELRGSASVGLAVYPEDGTTKEELKRSADAAMYSHKEAKRQRESMMEELERLGQNTLL